MKPLRISLMSLAASAAILLPTSLSAQIINIDFIGTRSDSATPEPTPHGASGYPSPFTGGGTVYNDIVADDTANTDNLTVAGLNLMDSHGGATTIGFTISPVGADNNGLGLFNGSDLFINSANNHALTAAFTISGLGSATSITLAFLTTGDGNTPVATFNGVPVTTIADNGYQYEFQNIPVIAGTVTGMIGGSNTNPAFLISGLGIQVTSVPETSTWTMMGLAAGILLYRLRRRTSV